MKFYCLITTLFLSLNLFSQNAVVFAVHDGDSYKIKMDDSKRVFWVRLEGVDCPELISNTISQNQPYGKVAGDSIRVMIKKKHVQVDSVGVDVYNRTVAKVFLFNGSDTINLAEYIVYHGLGWVSSTGLPIEYSSELRKLQADAIYNRRGLWGDGEKPIAPYIWRIRYKR